MDLEIQLSVSMTFKTSGAAKPLSPEMENHKYRIRVQFRVTSDVA